VRYDLKYFETEEAVNKAFGSLSPTQETVSTVETLGD